MLNNPLKYTDPSGELFFSILFGAYLGGSARNDNFTPFKWNWNAKTWENILSGGIIGATSNILSNNWNSVKVISKFTEDTRKPFRTMARSLSHFTTATSAIANSNNALKIFAGRYYTDDKRTLLGQVWQGISRLTWEAPQTWLGYNYTQIRNTIGEVDRVDYLGGATFATRENMNNRHGISIGNFININNQEQITGEFTDYVLQAPLYMHEYGHYIDGQLLGLSYLIAVGLPSLISAGISTSEEHSRRGYEIRANRKAARYFGRYYGVDWTNFEPPHDRYHR